MTKAVSYNHWTMYLIKEVLILVSLFVITSCDVRVERANDTRGEYLVKYKFMLAKYSPGLPQEGLVGFLVVAEPSDACSPIQPPPQMKDSINSVIHWVLLIDSWPLNPTIKDKHPTIEKCSHLLKIKHATAANFSAAIVFNSFNDELVQMTWSPTSDYLIPSVYIGHIDGISLMEYTYQDGRLDFVVRIVYFDVVGVLMTIIPFLLGCLCGSAVIGLITVIFRRRNQRRERQRRMSVSSLNEIPTRNFVEGDEENYDICCVCQEKFQIGDELRILPCEHVYHTKCVDQWLVENQRICPQCRKEVVCPVQDGESSSRVNDRTPLLDQPTSEEHPVPTWIEDQHPILRTIRALAGCLGGVTNVREEGDQNGEGSDESWRQILPNNEDIDEEADTNAVNTPNLEFHPPTNSMLDTSD